MPDDAIASDGTEFWERRRDLTLGHFTRRDGYERLLRYLEENRSLDVPSVAIDGLELVALNFSDGRFPPYETVAAYDLS